MFWKPGGWSSSCLLLLGGGAGSEGWKEDLPATSSASGLLSRPSHDKKNVMETRVVFRLQRSRERGHWGLWNHTETKGTALHSWLLSGTRAFPLLGVTFLPALRPQGGAMWGRPPVHKLPSPEPLPLHSKCKTTCAELTLHMAWEWKHKEKHFN